MTSMEDTPSTAEEAFNALIQHEGSPIQLEEFQKELWRGLPKVEAAKFEELLRTYDEVRQYLGGKSGGNRIGRKLGGFRLIQLLGQGASSEVWRAKEVALGRTVALKILHPHLCLHPDSLQRFNDEASACGRLEHTHVAKLHSIGEEDGVHYIAQELVSDGLDLHSWIQSLQSKPGLPEGHFKQAALIASQVADALQHAHERGVIHRDVKPSNVLLGPELHPKLADFGFASLQHEPSSGLSMTIGGTPLFMSPEQARHDGTAVDERTDIFSLGAALYEMLTLHRPFQGNSTPAVFDAILKKDPLNPVLLQSDLPRDLATICLRALEKEPSRRYQTAQEFGDDLRRFLAKEPILAKPPSRSRRIFLWASRHPGSAAAVLTGAFALVITSLLLLSVSRSEAKLQIALDDVFEEQKRTAAAAASYRSELDFGRAVESFLVDTVTSFPSTQLPSSADQWRFVVDSALANANQKFDEPGPHRAGILLAVAKMYREMLLLEEAEVVIRDAISEMDPTASNQASLRRLWAARSELGGVLVDTNRIEEALPLLEECLAVAKELWMPGTLDLLTMEIRLAEAESQSRHFVEADRRLIHVLKETQKDSFLALHLEVDVLEHLSQNCSRAGRLQDALLYSDQAESAAGPVDDRDPSLRRALAMSRGNLLSKLGRPEEAEACFRIALQLSEQKFGVDHPKTLGTASRLADTLWRQGKLKEGIQLVEEAMPRIAEMLGPDSLVFLVSKALHGAMLAESGESERALQIVLEVYQAETAILGPTHDLTLSALNNYAVIAQDLGLAAEAVEHLTQGWNRCQQVLGLQHPTTLTLQCNLATAYSRLREWDRAVDLLQAAVPGFETAFGPAHEQTLKTLEDLAGVFAGAGRFAEAYQTLEDVMNRADSEHQDREKWQKYADIFKRRMQAKDGE